MIRVNLLPHRQIRRAERQREFGLMALMMSVAAAAVVFFGWSYLTAKIEEQNERNNRLDQAVAKLDKDIESIKELKNKISEVLDRKQVVENLQTDRSQAVVIMDELSRKLPDGMYLKSIKQQGRSIVIEGVADTNARIATLVGTLSTSEWLESPNLVEIKSSIVNNLKQNDFVLTVNLKAPQAQGSAGKADAGQGGAS